MNGTTTTTPPSLAAAGEEAARRPADAGAQLRPVAWWPALLIAGGLALLLTAIGYALHGKPLAEKTLTALAMPVGALWLLLSARLVHLLAVRRLTDGKLVALLWLGLFVCGTRPLPEALTRFLETSLVTYDPTHEAALDVAIVLGGGTHPGNWRAQVSGAGDRVVMAAELFHLGFAKRLVTTGAATAGVSRSLVDPGDETIEIWTALGIPRSDILKLGGRNTSEEMAAIKQAWPQWAGKRVGLITSANHLPRAMRLARAQGLELIAVAADVRYKPGQWRWLDFIPTAGNLASLASNQHEIMAYFVSR